MPYEINIEVDIWEVDPEGRCLGTGIRKFTVDDLWFDRATDRQVFDMCGSLAGDALEVAQRRAILSGDAK